MSVTVVDAQAPVFVGDGGDPDRPTPPLLQFDSPRWYEEGDHLLLTDGRWVEVVSCTNYYRIHDGHPCQILAVSEFWSDL